MKEHSRFTVLPARWIKQVGEDRWQKLLLASLIIWQLVYFLSFREQKLHLFFSPVYLFPFLLTIAAGRWDLFFRPFNNVVVVLVLLAQTGLLTWNLYLEYYSLNFNFFDSGFFWNPVSNFYSGKGFFNSEIGLSEFADHFCPSLLLLLYPFHSIPPDGMGMLGIRLVSFPVSVWFLYQLLQVWKVEPGRRNFLLLLWGTNLGVVNYLGFEFQPSNLIVPFVFLLFRLFYQKKGVWFGLAALFMLGLKENASLVLISLGLFSAVYMERRMEGFLLTGVGVILLWAIPRVLMPILSGSPGVNDSALSLSCCIPDKIHFILMILLCSGFFLIFHPWALFVVLPSLAGSLLISRPGAHTIEFHYQDIPVAISFAVLGFLLSRYRQEPLPKPFSLHSDFRIMAALLFGVAMNQNQYSTFYYVKKHTPTEETHKAIQAMRDFRRDYNGTSRIWAQTSLAFYLGAEYHIKCIMNADETIADAGANYVVLCDASPGKWPIDSDYDRLKTLMREDVQRGVRVEHKGYPPLIIFERK